MNKNLYEVKIKFRKTSETGQQKIVTVPYLFEAVNYTDCEARVYKEMPQYISEEFKVTNIKPVNYAEIHHFEDSEKWFKSKVSLIAYDEESGRERKSNIYLLINANDVDDAYASTVRVMKNTMGEYSIPAISETAIVEVFLYQSQE